MKKKSIIKSALTLILAIVLFAACSDETLDDSKEILGQDYAAVINAQVDYAEIFERRDISRIIELANITTPLPTPSPIPMVDFTLSANVASLGEGGEVHLLKKEFSSENIANEAGNIIIGLPSGTFLVFFTSNYKGITAFLGYLSFAKFGGSSYSSLIETEALEKRNTSKKISVFTDIGKLKFDEDKGIVYPEKRENDPYCSIDSDEDRIFDCNDDDANGNGVLDREEFDVPLISFDQDDYNVTAGESLSISGYVEDDSGDTLDTTYQTSPTDLDFISIDILDNEIEIEISPQEKDIGIYEITITASNSNGTVVKVIEINIFF